MHLHQGPAQGAHWNPPWHSASPGWAQVEYFKSLNFMLLLLQHWSHHLLINVFQWNGVQYQTRQLAPYRTRQLCILRWELINYFLRWYQWITEYFHQEVVDSLRKANNSVIKWEVCYFSLLCIICGLWFLFLYFLSNSRWQRITNITEGKMSLWNKWKIKVPNEGTETT